MNIEFLRAFAHRVSAEDRISAKDVADLRRHEADAETAGEGLDVADALLAIDALPIEKHAEWHSLLIEAMVDLLVWGERPTGMISAATADWLLTRIRLDGANSSHRALLVAIVREAQDCDPRLAAVAFGYRDVAPVRAPAARTLGWLDASGLQV